MDTDKIGIPCTPLLPSSKELPKKRLVTVEPLAFFFAASIGAAVALQPQYIEERLAQDRNYTLSKDDDINGTCNNMNTSDPDYIIQQEIAADMATWTMINTSLSFLPVVFLAPFYGVLSDRLGRKLNFAIPIIAHVVFCILLLLILYLRLPLLVLAIANLVEGLGGQICFFIAGSYAYISDVSTKKARLVRLAVLQSVYFSAVGIVQIPIGYIIQAYGFIPVAWLSVALLIAAILYLTIPRVLLDSVEPNKTSKPIGARELFHDLYKSFAVNDQNRRYRLLIILTIYFFTDIFQMSTGATMIYGIYGLGPPFCWSSVIYGYYSVVFMVFGAIGLLFGSKLFSLCLQDHWILQIAYLFGGLSNLFLAWAPTTALFFLGGILGCLRGMDGPVLNSIISKLVSPQEQGTIFAVESSVQSAASLISPLILNSIYSASVKTQPSLVFYVIAGIFFILIILTWLWVIYTRKAVKPSTTTDNIS
ncbi:proton-coupled folate transporter-like [Amphiura filiformis]|uniref:proton-coupled folate transporter-like n=1 Tax=Amphiura filiformis TaxID=82378 RepID=UPI003B223E13